MKFYIIIAGTPPTNILLESLNLNFSFETSSLTIFSKTFLELGPAITNHDTHQIY